MKKKTQTDPKDTPESAFPPVKVAGSVGSQKTKFIDQEDPAIFPANIHFGASSWTYPGWRGVVYRREYRSTKEFNRESLREYCQYPLFTTVGIDSFFYAPPKAQILENYASQVPAAFRWVAKVWESITIPRFPHLPRYGAHKGTWNDHFLSSVLLEQYLEPCRRPGIREHCGPFVLQFPHISPDVMGVATFLQRLGEFLELLPRDFQFGIELRNREFLVPQYFEMLNASGCTHCFNQWSTMVSMKEQMLAASSAGGLEAPFYVARILTPLGVSYEEAVRLFAPYDRLQRDDKQMQCDVLRLVRRGIERQAATYIIINNRCEGNAPGSVARLAQIWRAEQESGKGG